MFLCYLGSIYYRKIDLPKTKIFNFKNLQNPVNGQKAFSNSSIIRFEPTLYQYRGIY